MVAGERTLLRGGQVVDPSQGLDEQADLLVEEGRVAWVAPSSERRRVDGEVRVIDVAGLVVCPGFVDLHAHLREPGQEHKETIATGTLAAARGGFTTVCAMPNTEPPVDNAAVVRLVRQTAGEQGHVRVLPIGCVTVGRKGKQLVEMAELAAEGVVGYSDDGDPVADARLMRMALAYSTFVRLPVIQHCEDPALAAGGVMNDGWVASRLGLRGVPAQAEAAMAARDVQLAGLTGGRLHLAHVSTAETVDLLRRARAQGISVTAEVTPHHLTLTDEWVLGRQGREANSRAVPLSAYDTRCKVNPPLRTERDIAALVEALVEGVIDAIATDHAPHAANDKECTFDEAAFGISGLETAFGLLMRLVHEGKLSINTVIERLTAGPARVLGERGAGLGTLRAGLSADIAVLDPDAKWTVDSSRFASRGRNTPLDGVTLRGAVVATLVGGRIVHQSLRWQPSGAAQQR